MTFFTTGTDTNHKVYFWPSNSSRLVNILLQCPVQEKNQNKYELVIFFLQLLKYIKLPNCCLVSFYIIYFIFWFKYRIGFTVSKISLLIIKYQKNKFLM